MVITLQKVSKRYTRHWIVRNIDFTFSSPKTYGIQGDNGSGKSTLLKMVSGFLSPSIGKISYVDNDGLVLSTDELYQHISIWGPYVSLLKNLSIREMIEYYVTNKSLIDGRGVQDVVDMIDLGISDSALVGSLSSGQGQRLGLALTIAADTPLLLLDEPGSYLDVEGKTWMHHWLSILGKNRLVIIASNELEDLAQADEMIDIHDFH